MALNSEVGLSRRVVVSLIVMVVVTFGSGGLFLLLKSLKQAPPKAGVRTPRTVVRYEIATPRPYREELSGYGRARALRAAEISAEVAGLITEVDANLDAGAAVESGDVLLKIDDRNYREAVASATAREKQADSSVSRLQTNLKSLGRRLTVARADLEAAKRELKRVDDLAEDGVVTRSDLDRQRITTSLREKEVIEFEWQENAARQDLVRAVAEVEAAASALARAELDLSRATVRAPFTGRVEKRYVSEGTRVGPGTALCSLVDLSRVEVPIALGASQFGEVEVGSAAKLFLGGSESPVWTGEVRRIGPTVNDRDRTFIAYLEVEGNPLAAPVPPGAFVLARIEGALHENVIPVPRTAFVGIRVYLARPGDDGEAIVEECTPVVERFLPGVALVRSGIESGERVIVTNLEEIAAGSRVLLVSESPGRPEPDAEEDRQR